MEDDKVIVERRGPVAIVTINRPQVRNVVDAEVAQALEAAFDSFDEHNSGVLAVVLTGAGDKAFSAGMDLKAFAQHGPNGGYFTERGGFAGLAKRDIKQPLVVAVNGPALGGGMEIALTADCVIASENATFGLPETKRGLIAAGGGAIRIGKRVPRGLALEMAMTGDPIDAQRALSSGLVNAIVPLAEVVTAAEALALRIASASPIAVRTTRQLVLDSLECGEAEGWEKSREASRIVLRSPDSKEGTKAFIEKRSPVWAPV
jgi:enoyl-CoA hydratase/carnithine racemase